jgi:hypothetical protein
MEVSNSQDNCSAENGNCIIFEFLISKKYVDPRHKLGEMTVTNSCKLFLKPSSSLSEFEFIYELNLLKQITVNLEFQQVACMPPCIINPCRLIFFQNLLLETSSMDEHNHL